MLNHTKKFHNWQTSLIPRLVPTHIHEIVCGTMTLHQQKWPTGVQDMSGDPRQSQRLPKTLENRMDQNSGIGQEPKWKLEPAWGHLNRAWSQCLAQSTELHLNHITNPTFTGHGNIQGLIQLFPAELLEQYQRTKLVIASAENHGVTGNQYTKLLGV